MCPTCGGPTENHDRCYPPNPYNCDKCEQIKRSYELAVAIGAPKAALELGLSERQVRRHVAAYRKMREANTERT